MAYEKRPYPLLDEIKMHVFLWASDNDWKKLPPPIKEAVTITMNEIKVREALKSYGLEDDRVAPENLSSSEKRKFIALFKQKYLEYSDLVYNGTIDSATLFIVGNLVQRLLSEGSNSLEYLNWFFDEFMREEYNKQKFAPPSIKIATSNFVVDKYLFQNKDNLRVRKQSLLNAKVKNAVAELATRFLEKVKNREFALKILDFSRGEISLKKFSAIFLALLHKHNEAELIEELKKIVGE